MSYYTKGALIGLCLDLSLRQSGHSLDEVMRGLWKRCKAGPMTEDDLLAVLKDITGRSGNARLKAWVHGTAELPVQALLQAQGVSVHWKTSAPMAQQLGLRVQENHAVQVQTVLNGSAAEAAGFAPGDEWLGMEVLLQTRHGRRHGDLKKLDQLPAALLGKAKQCTALVSPRWPVAALPLRMPAKPLMQWRLGLSEPGAVGQWLADNLRA